MSKEVRPKGKFIKALVQPYSEIPLGIPLGIPVEEGFADPTDESVYVKTINVLGIPADRTAVLLPLPQRTKYLKYVRGDVKEGSEEFKFWNSEKGRAFLASFEDATLLLKGLTELVTALSDEKTVECLKAISGKQLRKFFEISNPITQCENTIGRVERGKTPCWICGTPIPETDYRGLELSPECEHVFPVAQALVFSGLYEAQLFREMEDVAAADAYLAGVSLEYKWAHRICNQVKNDSHFISYVRDGHETGHFEIEKEKIRTLINDIVTTQNWGNRGALFAEWIKTNDLRFEVWVENAIENIYVVSEKLLSYAQKSGLTLREHTTLTVMCMRSYIATSSKCVGTIEVIEKPKSFFRKEGDAAFTGRIGIAPAIAVTDHYINRAVEDMTGILQSGLNQLGRLRVINARERADITLNLPTLQTLVEEELRRRRNDIVQNIRQRALYFVKTNVAAADKAWSSFQVLTSQLPAIAIYVFIAKDGLEKIMTALRSRYGEPKINLINTTFATALDAWLNSKKKVVKNGGVDYDSIMNTSDPGGTDPEWFSLTGGGKRTTRRPLYG